MPTLFEPPADLDEPIWRYLSFAKFVAMLETGALHFTRAIDLEEEDPFEGRLTEAGITLEGKPLRAGEVLHRTRHLIRVRSRVNCWHRSRHESVAMWRVYGKHEGAIAVQSTFRALSDVLGDAAHVGVVKYLDYETETIEIGHLAAPLFSKRREFEYEQEVRALEKQREGALPAVTRIMEAISKGTIQELEASFAIDGGRDIPVALDHLLQEVVVAPSSGKWFEDLTRNVLARHGLAGVRVRRSRIDNTPADA